MTPQSPGAESETEEAVSQPAPPPPIMNIRPPIWMLVMLMVAYALGQAFDWASIVYMQSTPLAILFGLSGIALAVWAVRTFSALGTEINPASPSNKLLV